MVINSKNRSPSPMSMRPNPNYNPNSNPNPNPNSRINQARELLGVRKSFSLAKSSISGQPRSLIPNTPVNSPAEFVRRCSFGNEGGISLQDNEKENERDPNSKPVARVRSPSVPKMTKNFMSPTISAVSKINPSPRKKVLGERNEAIRTSASLSEGKFHFYSTSGSLDFSDENEPKEDMVTPPCSTFSHMNKLDELFNKEPEKKVTDFSLGVEKIELEPDLVVLRPEMPLNDAQSSELIPQKCDMPNVFENNVGLKAKVTTCSSPSTTIPPLDADPCLPPYDPKTNILSPRPQFLHYKPNPRIESYINQGIRLEDGFSSESFSESEISEEVQSEETSSVGKSLEVDSSFSESNSSKIQQLEESVEHKIEARHWFGGMWKAVCLISLVVLFGFTAVYQGNFAEESFKLLSNMSFKAREVKFSPLPFDNLTAWQEMEVEDGLMRDSLLRLKDFELRPSNSGEEIELKSLYDYEEENDPLIEEFERQKLEENHLVDDSVIEDEDFAVEMIEDATFFSEVENQEAEYGVTSEVQNEFQCDFKVEDQLPSSLSQASGVQPQVTTENDPIIEVQGEFQVDINAADQSLLSLPKAPEVQPQVMTANDPVTQVSESLAPIFKATDERRLASSIAAAILFVLSLLAAVAFMMVKKSGKATSITEKKKSTCFLAASKIKPKVHENQTSWSGPVEVDMMDESCPSEMSSFQKASSYNLKGSHEAQNAEKSSKSNYKRESLASSSSEYTMSTSYGSFTTYSILHSKQGDDEAVTPVRRSSRIKSKVTSPRQAAS